MLWFVSNVCNVSNDGRLAGLVIGAKSDRGRVHSYPLLISTLDSSRLGGGGGKGMKFRRAEFIQKRIYHLQDILMDGNDVHVKLEANLRIWTNIFTFLTLCLRLKSTYWLQSAAWCEGWGRWQKCWWFKHRCQKRRGIGGRVSLQPSSSPMCRKTDPLLPRAPCPKLQPIILDGWIFDYGIALKFTR